ncbi:MAG: tRNA (adenosine(37)-N6)-threonylcarbamoyltransferase complex dimerization subunit type 1 TsaB [Petrimonas sp.]|nr:tRNA (adenosine(37)-N6)-threonylcarbamoyltransferase complex dimerization subunit type 1 TsaB [Petrimonas sp.]
MSTFLQIETATPVCSATLSKNGEIVYNKEDFTGQSHAVKLGVFVEETMQHVRREGLHVDAVVVSSGPGSYTGLRIGVSEAKGLSYGLGAPLIAIPTPLIMAHMLKDEVEEDALLCPMIDARRMEVYATFFDTSLNVVRPTAADIVTENGYSDLLENHRVVFFGNGADKCKTMITHPNARFLPDVYPLASAMTALAEKAFTEKDFVDTAYFEPFYLKEFVATVPKNKVLSNI